LSQETTALHADPHFMIILHYDLHLPALHSFPTRRSSDLLHYETATQEADEVARLVQERVAEGAWKYDDVAVLVRSNADADQFLRSLNLRGIPWTFSGNAGLYGRPEIRLLIAFLRAVAHPDDSVSVHYL